MTNDNYDKLMVISVDKLRLSFKTRKHSRVDDS